jgi:hypothetical protein
MLISSQRILLPFSEFRSILAGAGLVVRKRERSGQTKVHPKVHAALAEVSGEVEDPITRSIQLSHAYAKAKKDFFHARQVQVIPATDPLFANFVYALRIIDCHKVSYEVFIEAQVAGLQFQDHSQFPVPGNLPTEAAETRLLKFLRGSEPEDEPERYRRIAGVRLSERECEMSLTANEKYILATDRLLSDRATLKEAKYVRALQKLKLGHVEAVVKRYIRTLREDRSR